MPLYLKSAARCCSRRPGLSGGRPAAAGCHGSADRAGTAAPAVRAAEVHPRPRNAQHGVAAWPSDPVVAVAAEGTDPGGVSMPDRGIDETSTSFDAAVLLAATAEATPRWPAVNP